MFKLIKAIQKDFKYNVKLKLVTKLVIMENKYYKRLNFLLFKLS